MENLVVNAFSNTVRIKILCCLANKSRNVQELMTKCNLSQSAVSQHLIKLKNAELVKSTKRGKFVYYSLIDPKAAKIAEMLKAYCEEEK